jgi:hypothetical protein
MLAGTSFRTILRPPRLRPFDEACRAAAPRGFTAVTEDWATASASA